MDEAEKSKYFSFEPAAFLAEFVGMTRAQRGAYCSLIMWLYNNGGRMPWQCERIAEIMQSHDDFEPIWEVIGPKFIVKDGCVSHKRVTKEIEMVHNYRERKKLAAQTAARARWGKECDRNATAMLNHAKRKRKRNTIIDDVDVAALDNPIGDNNTPGDMAETTTGIVMTWNTFVSEEKRASVSPHIDLLIYELRSSTTEPLHKGQIITAIENYGKVLKVTGHTANLYKLHWFLKKGVYLFTDDAFDMDMWTPKKKGRKPSEVLADDAKRS